MHDSPPADAAASYSLWATNQSDEGNSGERTVFTIGELARDFGVTLITRNLVQLPLEKAHVEIYGVPGNHNGSGDQRPFMTMPTDCSPLRFTFLTRSWEPDAPFISEESETPPMEACQSLPFKPSLDLDLTNPKPDSPTGLGIDLNLEQNTNADERASTGIKDATIDLPLYAPHRADRCDKAQALTEALREADGIIVAVHPNPDEAICDGPQQIVAADFPAYAAKVEAAAAVAGKRLAAVPA